MRQQGIAVAAVAAAVLALVGAAVAFAATHTSASNYGYGMMGRNYVYRPAQATPVRSLVAASAQAQRFADRLGLKVDEVLQFKDNFYAKLIDSGGNGATEVLVDPPAGVVSIEYGPAMMWNTKYGVGRGAAGVMGRYGRSMMRGYGGTMMRQYAPGSSASGADTPAGPGYGTGMMGGSGSGGMMGGSGNGPGSAGSGGTSTAATVTIADARSRAQEWLDRNEAGMKVETGGDAFLGYYTFETLRNGKITGMISVNATTGAVWPHWWHGAFIAKSEG
jgi:hypothetical protein